MPDPERDEAQLAGGTYSPSISLMQSNVPSSEALISEEVSERHSDSLDSSLVSSSSFFGNGAASPVGENYVLAP